MKKKVLHVIAMQIDCWLFPHLLLICTTILQFTVSPSHHAAKETTKVKKRWSPYIQKCFFHFTAQRKPHTHNKALILCTTYAVRRYARPNVRNIVISTLHLVYYAVNHPDNRGGLCIIYFLLVLIIYMDNCFSNFRTYICMYM